MHGRGDLAYLIEQAPRAVAQSLEGVAHVARIVRAMKEFSHPGSDAKELIDLNRVIETTVTLATNEWKYVARVDFDLDPHLPAIHGHPGELGQVVLNLIINSVHAIKERFGNDPKGIIKIATRLVKDSVEVTFIDNGCGGPQSCTTPLTTRA